MDGLNSPLLSEIASGLALIDEGLFRYCDLTKKFEVNLNGKVQTYKKGDGLLIPKSVQHSVAAKSEVVLLELWEK